MLFLYSAQNIDTRQKKGEIYADVYKLTLLCTCAIISSTLINTLLINCIEIWVIVVVYDFGCVVLIYSHTFVLFFYEQYQHESQYQTCA